VEETPLFVSRDGQRFLEVGYVVSLRSPNEISQLSRHGAGGSRTRTCKSQ
jgi:hypothetical protein